MTEAVKPATSAEQWEAVLRFAAPTRHQAASKNALSVASCRARLAVSNEEHGLTSCMTASEVAFASELNNDQVGRGTRTLREWGFLTTLHPPGQNTPATYVLTVPDQDAWREAWHTPPTSKDVVDHPLTAGQEQLMELVDRFVSDGSVPDTPGRLWEDQVLVIHGFAGSGKTTTVVRAVRQYVPDLSTVLFIAPSNKAAAVLRDEGVEARTIHGAYYRMTGEDQETGDPIFMPDPFNEGGGYSLVVVDEASMVNEDTARWVESQSRQVIVIGDPAQLAPVKGL